MSLRGAAALSDTPEFLNGGGEMGALLRAHDWASTPLGEPGSWPRALKTAVRLILNTGHPMYIWWGPDLLCFYNDPYRRTLGPERHPGSLGQPGRDVWAEIWPLIGQQVDHVMSGQGSTWDENRVVPSTRFGHLDEIYWTYSYSPIGDEGASNGVGGVLVVCSETTQAVLAERNRAAETERQRRLFEQAPGFITILAGPDHRFEFANASYRRLFGERDFIGKTAREVFPELVDQDFFALLDRVFTTGERFIAEKVAIRLQRAADEPDERFLNFIYEPVIGESGVVTGIFVEGYDVTEAHRADLALRAYADRQAFRLKLDERLRSISDPAMAIAAASEALGKQLGVGQIAFVQVGVDAKTVLIGREWNDGTMPPTPVRQRLDDDCPSVMTDLRRGEHVAIADVRRDPRTSSPDALAALEQASIRALLDVPLLKGGQLAAVLAVHSHAPRCWSREDIQLVEEVADRAWSAAERARTDASLREAEQRYLALFNAIDQGFCTIEVAFDDEDKALDYRFLEVSPAFEPQTGIANAQGRWMRDIAPGQDQHWFDIYGGVALTGQPARFENYSTPLGRWWDVYAFPIDKPRQIALLFRDITDQKKAEAALRTSERALRELNDELEQRVVDRTVALAESQRRFQGIFNSALQFMALLTLDGDVVEVNETALAWSELEPADMAGKPFWQSAPMRGDPVLQAAIEAGIRRAAEGETVRAEYEMRGAGDVRATIDFSVKPVSDETGKPIFLVAEGRDVTALKEAQDALRQSQKMEAMGALTGGVAHDFNNLLTPIVGSLDLLQRQEVGDDRQRRMIDGAMQSAERAKILVQRLLAFARRQPLQMQAVDVRDLIDGMADLVASTSGPRIRVEINVAPDVPAAKADANQVEMALLNLAVNARDAMPEGGTLSISARPVFVAAGEHDALAPGEYVRLAVADTGVGMDAATLKRAVEPFFSTKGIGRGTGLGLSMVHGLASQLGGDLTISSKEGLGTCVELYLPASEDAVQPRFEPGANSGATALGTILLVDDEELVRMSTADMLEDLGYQVVEAASAEEALRLADSGQRFDTLITDHLMPGITGTELAQELIARQADLAVLVVSGYAEIDGVAPELPRLIKPFRQADLIAKLAELESGL